MRQSDDTPVLDDAGIGNDTDPGESGDGGGRIRCPICAWQPTKESRWE